jgi:tRNA-specific 2-thiouridylase
MKLGADLIATGHYARVRQNGDKFELLKALDHTKDQSYFLHRLNQAQLSKSLFPLGEIAKTEVRKIAEKLQLPNAAKKDSTGICFIGERPFREFLGRYLQHKPGPIKLDNGQTVGEHVGLSFYTLGQRKGIGIGGLASHRNADGTSEPWFVARKDIANNTLYIVQGHEHPWLLSSELGAGQASWIAGEPPSPRALSAKTRYRQADVACTVEAEGPDRFTLRFTDPQWAVTPGQSAVLYDGDVCLGGGIIDMATQA